MDFKAARRMELFCQYAVAAAAEAMKNAGIDMEKEDPYRVGCYVGSGIGSLQARNGSIKDCWSVEHPGSIHFLFR